MSVLTPMATKKPAVQPDAEAPAAEAPTEPKAKVKEAPKPAMTLDQQMVHAALNAGVEA